MNTTDLFKKIDTALENLPEEIRSFLFDGEFDAVFETYKKEFTDQEIWLGIKNKTLEYVLGVVPATELKLVIEHSTTNNQLVDTIKKDIQEKVVTEILLILEVHKEMEEGIAQQDTVPKNDITTRLKESLIKPASVAQTKRDYSTTTVSGGAPSIAESAPKPSIDPYREIPDEK